MNPELINQLHSGLKDIDLQLEGISKEWQQIEERWDSVLSDWEGRVIAIGQALIESKAKYGKGWKRDYHSLGFQFSYTVACRYAACAEHPDARGVANSVEEWAKAASDRKRAPNKAETAKEAERIKKAEARKLNEAKSSGNPEEYDEQVAEAASPSERMTVNHNHLKSAVNDCCHRDQMQESFDLLHDAIVTDPRLKNLKPYWQRLLAGLEQGLLPRIRAVSPDEADDTVAAGGVDIEIDTDADLLNA